MLICSPCWYEMFLHIYADSFSIKTCLYETDNVHYPENQTYFHKTISCFSKFNKNKGQINLDTSGYFAYFSSYLQTKTFAWKRDCRISLKLQMLQRWPRPFQKTLIKFYKVHEKELSLTLSWRRPLSYRKQSTDLLCKSMD